MGGKKLCTPLKEKVAGVEFGMECARLAAEKGKSLFLLGGKDGVAKAAAYELKRRFPTLRIAGTRNGYFDRTGKENADVIAEINESGADILFVCLGAPAQEKWIYENRASIKTPGLIACLGGSLDIYSGTSKRAPQFFIKMRVEWLYRLLREPTRIGRMMNLPKFMISVCKYKRNLKKTRNIK
ncbi:MAG: WecB/TagA/CpsF family glycosyltransferase [Clostridia bacterium]|nr:WecB/TagA/CpsF family glycosyltransferase [Clostridia bacterium]